MTPAEQADFDARVLAHVTRYPGLSCWEISRALGQGSHYGRNIRTSPVRKSLERLALAGKAEFERIPGPHRGGFKRVWKAKDPA